ncbi:MAG: hypothetical protein U0T83_00585 [Bacteriovoracaceae bacterium]
MSNPELYKSLAVLEDLRVLSPASNDRLIDQLNFYLNNIQNPAIVTPSENVFSKIVGVLDNQIEFIVENFCKIRPDIKEVSVTNNIETNNLKGRELLFDNIDLMLKAYEVLGMFGSFILKIDAKGVSLTGLVNLENISEAKKINVYKITRLFLKKKILFTYKLHSKNGFAVELFFDFFYTSTTGCSLFDNQLNKYEINFEKFYKLNNHACLEITDEMHLIRYKAISEAVKLSKSQKIIVHFPFLFRHISLIIPSREEFESGSLRNKLSEPMCFDFFSIFND